MDLQSYLSWNVRGANCAPSRYLVRSLVLKLKPAVVCLQETKRIRWSEKSLNSLGMPVPFGWVESPSLGQSGGLLTLWDKNIFTFCSSKSTDNWSMVKGSCLLDNRDVAIINIYAPQSLILKKRVWGEILDELACINESHVLLMGDFNAVRKREERSNTIFKVVESLSFNDFIDSSGLLEVNPTNTIFTWYGPEDKCSRLDRILTSKDWYSLGNWTVQALDRVTSDHKPLCLSTNLVDWGPKPFKFFNCWLEEPNFVENLKHSWSSCNLSGFTNKFRHLRKVARTWNEKQFGGIDSRIKELIESQKQCDEGQTQHMENKEVQVQLDKLLNVKVSILCQKARLNWDLKGEKIQSFSTEL